MIDSILVLPKQAKSNNLKSSNKRRSKSADIPRHVSSQQMIAILELKKAQKEEAELQKAERRAEREEKKKKRQEDLERKSEEQRKRREDMEKKRQDKAKQKEEKMREKERMAHKKKKNQLSTKSDEPTAISRDVCGCCHTEELRWRLGLL